MEEGQGSLSGWATPSPPHEPFFGARTACPREPTLRNARTSCPRSSPPQFFPPFRPGYPIAGIQPLASFRVFRGHILGSSLQLRYADVFLHATQFDVLADLIAHR
jgi:hypothetical protein